MTVIGRTSRSLIRDFVSLRASGCTVPASSVRGEFTDLDDLQELGDEGGGCAQRRRRDDGTGPPGGGYRLSITPGPRPPSGGLIRWPCLLARRPRRAHRSAAHCPERCDRAPSRQCACRHAPGPRQRGRHRLLGLPAQGLHSGCRPERGALGRPVIDANDARQFGLGYVHDLSRRTALYATAARISHDGAATFVIPGGPAGLGGGRSSTGFEAGVRHLFWCPWPPDEPRALALPARPVQARRSAGRVH